MSRGGHRLDHRGRPTRRSPVRAGVLMLVAVLISLCGAAPVASEPAGGQSEVTVASAELAADDSVPQAAASRVARAGRTDRCPTAQTLAPSPPHRPGRVKSPSRRAVPPPGVRNDANARAHHTVLRC
ncbi:MULTISPECIES: hypothetical protein [Streptomyces]|uniref:hypothetical protein n=1 Tax=Streptomyces TaxID=1883 RepID=UPI000B21DFB4|nr:MULTISPECIES: hypothetical protein [Streptomyces]